MRATITTQAGTKLEAVPSPNPGFCSGCHLYETVHSNEECYTAPEGYNEGRIYCAVADIVWVKAGEDEVKKAKAEATAPTPRTFTDPDGVVYEAVDQDQCEGCAFDKGEATVAGTFTEACFNSPKCNASANDGKAIIWVKQDAA